VTLNSDVLVSGIVSFSIEKMDAFFVGTDEIGIPLIPLVVFIVILFEVVDDDFLRSRREFSRILLLLFVIR